MNVTLQQVEGLAPDAASLKAGRALASVRHWVDLGHDEEAVWGQCQGSALYQTRVDRRDLTARCSCPSRKFPCKHALGLLLLAAASPASFATSPQPEWVAQWLAKRREKGTTTVDAASPAEATPPDEEARAKRSLKRHANVLAGIESLERWMEDVVGQGIARLGAGGHRVLEEQARRLVDAQAPGLAGRVRRIGGRVGSGDRWPTHVLEELGRLRLMTEAYRAMEDLDPLLAQDVRQAVGITVTSDDVVAHGDRVWDHWLVVGQAHETEATLHQQRTWLLGRESGRHALILQYAPLQGGFAESYAAGTVLRAELAFWPSATPLRALVMERESMALADPAAWPGSTLDALVERSSLLWGVNPFLDRVPALLDAAQIVPPRGATAARVRDASGASLPVAGTNLPALFALTGCHPARFAVEWDGESLSVVGVFVDGACWRGRGAHAL